MCLRPDPVEPAIDLFFEVPPGGFREGGREDRKLCRELVNSMGTAGKIAGSFISTALFLCEVS